MGGDDVSFSLCVAVWPLSTFHQEKSPTEYLFFVATAKYSFVAMLLIGHIAHIFIYIREKYLFLLLKCSNVTVAINGFFFLSQRKSCA